jgi:enoyl-CoA hydratase/carnithine racemase
MAEKEKPRVCVEVADRIATVTIDRPEARNAIDKQTTRELRAALDDLAERDEAHVLLLTGGGDKAFVSGADIAELKARKRNDALRGINASLFRQLEDFPRPTIAVIRGFALGGGCEIAMACDLRVAGESAKLGQPEAGLGILAAAGGTYRLPRLVGVARAKELLFTGAVIDAKEALAIGLVNRVVPDADVLAEAKKLAAKILEQSPLAVRLAKLAVNAWAKGGMDAWRTVEDLSQAVLFEDEEKERRMTAFLERKGSKK